MILCDHERHLITRLPTGLYHCVDCGQAFHEHHELVLTAGVHSAPGDRGALPSEETRDDA
jgi:hypothetical protein